MNFAITGKKITTTLPQKKHTTNIIISKPETKPIETRQIIRKPSVPAKTNIIPSKIQKKKQDPKKQVAKISKKQQEKKQIQNKTKVLQKETKEQAIKILPIQKPPQLPKQEPKKFQILVRYNHYKDKFPTQNNILKYEVIENKYNFADVFKGNYQPRLQIYRNYGKYIEPLTSGKALDFSWQIEEEKQYEITIAEDEEEESKYERKVYIAPKQEKCPLKKNHRVIELTNQMKEMNVQELGGSKHKQLLQQRALQQILFS